MSAVWCAQVCLSLYRCPLRQGRTIRSLLLCLCCATLARFPLSAFAADTVPVSGLPFPVDEYSPVDSRNVKITIFGESEIVSRDTIEEYVVGKYFSVPLRAHSFSFENLRDFVKESLRVGRYDRAASGFSALCAHAGEERADQLLEFLRSLETTVSYVDFFKAAALRERPEACPRQVIAELLLHAGFTDRAWMRTHAVREVVAYGPELRPLAEQEARRAGLSNNVEQLLRYVDFYGTAFGFDDPRYLELKVISSRFTQALDVIKQGSANDLFPLLDVARSDAWLGEMLTPLLVDALHRNASQALARGDAGGALSIISHVELKRRTPTTHELAAEALRKLSPSSHAVIRESGVAGFLRAIAIADARVASAYLDYVERVFDFLFTRPTLENVDAYYDIMTFLRPDPNASNDRIRVRHISLLLERDRLLSARDKLQDVQTGVPLFSKLRFALSGLYFDQRYIFVAFFAIFGAAVIVLIMEIFRRSFGKLKEVARPFVDSSTEQPEEEPPPVFVQSGFVRTMSPAMIEYREHLEVFGLLPGVSIKEIKAAYRNAVKEVHPDLHRTPDAKASERFISLTKTYEKLLKLHEEIHQQS